MAQFSTDEKLSQGYRDVTGEQQFACGVKFLSECGIEPGMTVVDMGCGPGNLTKSIVDKVGLAGHVYGIDPDSARVKVKDQ